MVVTYASEKEIEKAVTVLRQGGLVAIPTETVYGLAADANNPKAVKKIFHIKNRPLSHPVIVHIADISQLKEWATDISDEALQLAKHYWPGPLTLILKKTKQVSDIITGGQDTVGLRIPNHPLTQCVLKKLGSGVAAPSANRFGRISPTTADAVREELGNKVDYILDGGQCAIGVESTIVDASTDQLRILRPGMISAEHIEKLLNRTLTSDKKNHPRVSGNLKSHYAPQTKMILMDQEETLYLKKINREIKKSAIAIMTRKKINVPQSNIIYFSMPDDPELYAHDLYQTLREIDRHAFHTIFVEEIPDDPAWDAIRDRLKKASGQGSLIKI